MEPQGVYTSTLLLYCITAYKQPRPSLHRQHTVLSDSGLWWVEGYLSTYANRTVHKNKEDRSPPWRLAQHRLGTWQSSSRWSPLLWMGRRNVTVRPTQRTLYTTPLPSWILTTSTRGREKGNTVFVSNEVGRSTHSPPRISTRGFAASAISLAVSFASSFRNGNV